MMKRGQADVPGPTFPGTIQETSNVGMAGSADGTIVVGSQDYSSTEIIAEIVPTPCLVARSS